MTTQNESKGPAILFLGTWWALSNDTPFSDYAFVTALLLMGVGWLAIRVLGNATCRLGGRGWLLILQLAVWFGLFLWFIPADPGLKILTLWGGAIPLLLLGVAWRHLYERFPRLHKHLDLVPYVIACAAFGLLPLICWLRGPGFWAGVAGAFMLCTLASIPLHYGWRLGAPLPRGGRDARFGSEEAYRAAGMSDER
jgi:hypothetical protein